MNLTRVALEDLSDIRYSVALPPHERFARPEFVQAAFRGVYREGAAGAPDATYIMAIMAAVDRAWNPAAFIVDLTELAYTWGDEMSWLWDVGSHYWCTCRRPLAVVVSQRCQTALQSLDPEEFEQYCVDSFDAAVASIRRQQPAYQECIRAFHAARR